MHKKTKIKIKINNCELQITKLQFMKRNNFNAVSCIKPFSFIFSHLFLNALSINRKLSNAPNTLKSFAMKATLKYLFFMFFRSAFKR